MYQVNLISRRQCTLLLEKCENISIEAPTLHIKPLKLYLHQKSLANESCGFNPHLHKKEKKIHQQEFIIS
jgi:hypothetical protein